MRSKKRVDKGELVITVKLGQDIENVEVVVDMCWSANPTHIEINKSLRAIIQHLDNSVITKYEWEEYLKGTNCSPRVMLKNEKKI